MIKIIGTILLLTGASYSQPNYDYVAEDHTYTVINQTIKVEEDGSITKFENDYLPQNHNYEITENLTVKIEEDLSISLIENN